MDRIELIVDETLAGQRIDKALLEQTDFSRSRF